MKSFREWAEEQAPAGLPQKAWKAPKEDVLRHWSSLQPAVPFTKVRSVPPEHHGPTYYYDGIRITGSSHFIDCILSRIKDLARYEGPDTLLQLIYKQQQDNKTKVPRPNSYVFYLQVKDRGSAKSKQPSVPEPKITFNKIP